MNVHFLDCGTFRPHGPDRVLGPLARVPSVCLLVEDSGRLTLVDAGLGTRDMLDPRRLGLINLELNAITDVEQAAARQIERMGLDPAGVTDIICTHLDSDHAGGLSDFPDANVHVLEAERDAAVGEHLFRRPSYRACHLTHGPRWVTYHQTSGEDWFGLACIRELTGLGDRFVLVPLPGHTRGHCGVAIATDEGWLLHCGDAFYASQELDRAPIAVRFFAHMAHQDRARARAQLPRIKMALADGGDVRFLASHDQQAFEQLSGG